MIGVCSLAACFSNMKALIEYEINRQDIDTHSSIGLSSRIFSDCGMEFESVSKLALRCADRQIAAADFLNLYKEFYNEKVTNRLEHADTPNDDSELSNICSTLASDFVELLTTHDLLILADYAVEVLFVNYNSNLVRCFLPHMYSIENISMLQHFLSHSCSFFANLTDAIVIDQVCADLSDSILPNILSTNATGGNNLIIARSKLLHDILACIPSNVTISSDSVRDNLHELTSQLSKINKLLFKKLNYIIESKLVFKDAQVSLKRDSTHEAISSPSITSPQFIASPFSMAKNTMTKGNNNLKYQDMKLLRYFKNIWLNNKIFNWETGHPEYLQKYASIASSVFQESHIKLQPFDLAIADLIETSFTCFAQFVSNKQYHQSNSYFSLLERQWIIFITKQIPLLVLQHVPESPQIVTTALDNIDGKVMKSIRTYYSEKDDFKNRNEDLFDNYPSTSLDIRHDFIKNLIRLNLQSPNVIMKYLREDQMIDVKALLVTDDLVLKNSQGVQEVVKDIDSFISTSLDSLEVELIGNSASENCDGVQQILNDFENISPTKQKELSHCLISMLDDATKNLDFNRVTKICALLSFNFSHSLTSMLAFVTPSKVCEILMRFVDKTWQTSVDVKRKEFGDSEFETMNIFLSFSWSLLLLIVIAQTYDFSLINVAVKSPHLRTQDSFTLLFISKLTEIPDVFSLDLEKPNDKEIQMASNLMVENWLKDLFINGSISDSLLQSINAKQLSLLVPFIFKQILLGFEVGSINKVSDVVGGLEYFLQPFMLIGLIKVVYWLEQYLCSLKSDTISDGLIENIFMLLNVIFNPSSLNEDSASFHSAVLRLNATKLLKVLRRFRVQSQSNYGIYSSEATGNPDLELLIKKFLTVLQISPNYNIDPRILNTENDYPQKHLGYSSFLILNETPINKIMTNQINSFWNLHSSTYYNLDYLNYIIDLVTPRYFLVDVFRTLEYKLATYGVPGTRNKIISVESESVLNYFFYFLVLNDIKSPADALELLSLMDSNSANSIVDGAYLKLEGSPKQETAPDDDFDMLFGENDTSIQGAEDLPVSQPNNEIQANQDTIVPIRRSFGLIIHEMKKNYELAVSSGDVSKENYDKICKYHEKYLQVLKSCNF